MEPEKTIPENKDGVEVNVEDSIELPSEEEAKSFFGVAKDRLVAVNKWKDWAGALSAGFQLTNEQGQAIDIFPRKGNYFKINIPAPGIVSSGSILYR